MAVYVNQDIETSLGGDIQISSQGDVKLADAVTTHKAAANFLLRTDFGDYAPNETVGCNLGSYIGKLNTSDNREFMQYSVNKILQEKLFSVTDVEAIVVPFDINEVMCVITIGGQFLVDGTIQPVDTETLTYTFPYLEGNHITPIVVD